MRRLLPSTLAGRIILVLLVGLMAFHVGSLWLHQTGSDILLGSTQQRVTAERVAAAARAVGMVPPDARDAGRERYRFYRERGYPLTHHDIGQAKGESA